MNPRFLALSEKETKLEPTVMEEGSVEFVISREKKGFGFIIIKL